MSKRKDLTNQRFGRLTAIRHTDKLKHGKVGWECLCDCGNTHYANTRHLIAGNVRSCGCLANETRLNNLAKIDRDKDRVKGTRISMLNAKTPSSNTSGVKGVSWNKNAKKWQSYIYFEGKKYHLGLYDDVTSAEKARKEAEEKFFGPLLK